MLKLNDVGVAALAVGLIEGLSSTRKLEDFPEESIQKAFGQAKSRAEAIEAGAEEIPEISEDSLQTIGFIMSVQLGLVQLGFGVEEAPFVKEGFIAGANSADQSPWHCDGSPSLVRR